MSDTDEGERPKRHPTNGFQKGDPRINRKGRPKAYDDLRKLARELSWEYVTNADGVPVLYQGRFVTRIELILRQWAQSSNPQLQQAFVKAAFGEAPAQVEVSGKDGGPVVVAFGKWPGADGENDG